ncbi:MAG: right-handed parallel beta-helix repeat-containing protein [Halobacteriales archaeon]|nr:right-handed parallel beta-helix repeat-containing protein [Halobacteriales archaeon]
MKRRRALSRIGVSAIALTAGVPSISKAGPPSKGGSPADIVVPDDYSTIQAAVDAATAGETVLVDGGTYREQVLINKDLTLKGQDGATVEAPDGLTTYTIVESLSTWAPMVFAYGGSISSGEVSGSGTVAVDISGLSFDGRGDTGQSGRKTAVLYRNVGGATESAITDNSVTDLGTPGDSIGIVAYGDSDVRVDNNTLAGFGRGGIGANGDGGDHPSPNMVVRNNEIDSESDPGGSAPNGVQIGFGATGQVRENTIKNCRYADDIDGLFQASGILLFESDGVKVQGNTLENNDVAIAASAWGWFLGSANNHKVVKNDITDALIGVNLRATAWDQDGGLASFTNQDPSVNNNKVVNNDLADPEDGPTGEIGVSIESNDRGDDDGYEPAAKNNKVIRNTIEGFDEQISDEGTDTRISAIEP